MNGLVGDRFLKRFFGNQWPRRRGNPGDEVMTLPENETGKPADLGCPPREDPLELDATLESKKVGEGNKLTGLEDGSDLEATD